LNNNKLINEKLICAFRWSVLSSSSIVFTLVNISTEQRKIGKKQVSMLKLNTLIHSVTSRMTCLKRRMGLLVGTIVLLLMQI